MKIETNTLYNMGQKVYFLNTGALEVCGPCTISGVYIFMCVHSKKPEIKYKLTPVDKRYSCTSFQYERDIYSTKDEAEEVCSQLSNQVNENE
jgi:hypothetical protein